MTPNPGATSPAPVSSTGQPLAPGTGITYAQQQNEDKSFALWRDPVFDPLYNGYAWGTNPKAPPLSMAGRKALILQINAAGPAAASGQAPIEAIDWAGGDPSTTFRIAGMQGDSYFPAGQGDTQVVDIGQSGAVVPDGGYTGNPPPGTTPVFANLAALAPNPKRSASAPVPVASPVGIQEWPNSPYYMVNSNNPASAPAIVQGPSPTVQYVLTPVSTTNVFGQPVTEWFYILGPVAAPASQGTAGQ